jgi:Protein of unknown function (DUF4229)
MSQPLDDTDNPNPEPDAGGLAPLQSHAFLRYTTLRLALFLAALALLWLVRIRGGVLLVALALVLSGLASFVLLARQRDAMSVQLHAAQQRRRARSVARVSREDHDQDSDQASDQADRSDPADQAAS